MAKTIEWMKKAVAERDRTTGCWTDRPWKAVTPRGYPVVGVPGTGKNSVASRLILEMDGRPQPSPRHEVLHSCDNPPCLNPAHLRWGTRSENLRERWERGARKAVRTCKVPDCERRHDSRGLCGTHRAWGQSRGWSPAKTLAFLSNP